MSRAEYRRAYRFPTELDVPLGVSFTMPTGEVRSLRADTLRMNRDGLAFISSFAIPVGTKIETELTLTKGNVRAEGIVVRHREINVAGGKRIEIGVQFQHIDQRDLDLIAKYLFWEIAPRHGQRMQLTHESQNQRPAALPVRVLAPELVHAGLPSAKFTAKPETVSSAGRK